MTGKVLKTATYAVFAIAALSMLFLSGCSRQTQTQNPPPTPVSTKPADRIELMPTSSGEHLRRHIFDESGTEVETQIQYINGDRGWLRLRGDGTVAEYKLETKQGKLKIQRSFAADGKTVVAGKELRDDGSTKILVESMPDGAIKTTTYWFDGTHVFSIDVRRADGSNETTFFRRSGSLWIRKSAAKADAPAVEESYDKAGKLELRRQPTATGVDVLHFRADGTASYKQSFTESSNQWGYKSKTLIQVEEYAEDGKTVKRKLEMSDNGRNDVRSSYNYQADGTTIVRRFRDDGTVEHEEVLDRDGKVSKSKDYKEDEKVTESVDRSLFYESYQRDPVQSWQMQENYPYYRNADDN